MFKNRIELTEELRSIVNPLVLVGTRDLDCLAQLLERRAKAKKEFMPGIDVVVKPGVLDV